MKREQWQLWSAAISKAQCEAWIKKLKGELSMQKGGTFDNNKTEGARNTNIGWTNDRTINNTIANYGTEANRNVFNYDINFYPTIQFGEYSKGCKYNWHHDVDWDSPKMIDRKLSIVVQLSDPKEYDGGIFEFKHLPNPDKFIEQGSIIVFPSYQMHQVTEITEGTRYSLVCWAEGPRWR